MKLKYNWLIHLRYILKPSLNQFKAHIELQMSSYVNAKAIKLIDLFVSFAPLNAPLNRAAGSPASDRLRTGQKEHHLTFGATLNKWLEAWASEMQS